jgi:hypothetical protein
MKNVVYLVIFSYVFATCTKPGKNVTVKGRVYNPITGKGYEGSELRLLRSEFLKLPGGYKDVKRASTNENGEYEISKLSVFRLDLSARVNGYVYDLGWYVDGEYKNNGSGFFPVKKGKIMNVDYHAVPYGCLITNIKNINCEGSSDSMIFRSKSIEIEDDFPSLYSLPKIGCYELNNTMCDKFIMGKHVYEIKVFRNSGVTIKYDTIFIKNEENTIYNMHY